MKFSGFISFAALRYISYFFLIIRGFVIAKMMPPFWFGIWGFVLVMQEYLSYLNFGVHYGISVEITESSLTRDDKARMAGAGLLFSLACAAAVVALGCLYRFLGIGWFDKYRFGDYAIIVAALAGLLIIKNYFITLARYHKRLGFVNLNEILFAIIMLAVAFSGKNGALISNQLWAMLALGAVAIVIYLGATRKNISLGFGREHVRRLVRTGAALMFINICYYLIMLINRTIVSYSCDVATFGLYTFAISISGAIMLGVSSLLWALFPFMLTWINRDDDENRVDGAVRMINNAVSVAMLVMACGASILMPLILRLLPQYKASMGAIGNVMLAQCLLAMSCGASYYLIAKRKNRVMIVYNFAVMLLSAAIGAVLACFKAPMNFYPLALIVAYWVYTIILNALAFRSLSGAEGGFRYLECIPGPVHIGILLAMIASLLDMSLLSAAGFALCLVFMRARVAAVIAFVRSKMNERSGNARQEPALEL